jgi:hypothetical protein
LSLYNRDGLIRIKEDDTKTGAYTADGAWRVDDRADGPFVTRTGARRKDMTQAQYRTFDETEEVDPPDPTVPEAFVLADWDVDAGIELANVTINSLPNNGGSAITDVEYRVDGGTWTSSSGVGNFSIESLTGGVEVSIELRAINAIGASDPSDVKLVTPEEVPVEGYEFINAEAETLVAAMSVEPDDTRKAHIDTTVGSLKSAGIWAKLDRLWMLAAHDSQAARLDWITASNSLSAINSPTFTADAGYASDGSTSYLNSGFIPATHGVNYLLDSASMFGLVMDNYTAGSHRVMGSADASGSVYVEPFRATTFAFRSTIHAGTSFSSTARPHGHGVKAVNRSASTTSHAYDEGVEIVSSSVASTGRPAVAVLILGWSSNGTATLFMPANIKIGVAGLGGSLNSTEHATLNTILNDYIDGL